MEGKFYKLGKCWKSSFSFYRFLTSRRIFLRDFLILPPQWGYDKHSDIVFTETDDRKKPQKQNLNYKWKQVKWLVLG